MQKQRLLTNTLLLKQDRAGIDEADTNFKPNSSDVFTKDTTYHKADQVSNKTQGHSVI